MQCTACSKEYTKKEIVYSTERLPYCPNPFVCNEDHPNSPDNIVARGGAVKMFTESELEDNTFEMLEVSDAMKERIMKIATKPQSIRLSKLDIAHYLIMLQETRNLASISEAVRHCVSLAIKFEPIDDANYVEPEIEEMNEVLEYEKQVTPEPKEEGIKIVVGEQEEKFVF